MMGFRFVNDERFGHYVRAFHFADAACKVSRITTARRRGESEDSSSTSQLSYWWKSLYPYAAAIANDLARLREEARTAASAAAKP